MTNIGIDEVLNRLSVKFNRIFYDRDFVGCVSEDLQVIINNTNKCCVLVFPTLSPNYLRVVRYQAKLCDLAVISLGSGSARSIGVCHKKYFSTSISEEDCKKQDPCNIQMADAAASVTKKKRPPIQLYVPPAQRKSRLSTSTTGVQKKLIRDETSPKNIRIATDDKIHYQRIGEDSKTVEPNFITSLKEVKNNQLKDFCYCFEDVDCFFSKKDSSIPYFSYQCDCAKLFLFKDMFPYAKLLIFCINRIKHSFHWIRCLKENTNILLDYKKIENWPTFNKERNIFQDMSTTVSIFVPDLLVMREPENLIEEYQSEFQNSYCLCGSKIFIYLPNYMYCCYLPVPDFKKIDDIMKPDYYLDCIQDKEIESLYIKKYAKYLVNNCILFPQLSNTEDIDIDSLLVDTTGTESPLMPLQKDTSNCDSKTNESCAKLKITDTKNNKPHKTNQVSRQINQVIVLDERIESPKIGPKNVSPSKDKSKQNEHEQEKEIMRKTKQNINRKSRPIIKYVDDDDNDTLKIGKGDNINNWEDLFNDEGELEDGIFTEIVQKVGAEVTIVKATEDYSAYASKQVEELEHMVELYDFPSTFETQDIISAFSGLHSDSMYVKWVDDTHALLVLGSSTQAQKAIELSNPLIKARSMSAATRTSLEKANQFNLRPAMKRPPTNLQTARRLITSHLGAKSKVSKEQSAREREDLRLAKELKKQAKQNERDAWEGNLRSAIN